MFHCVRVENTPQKIHEAIIALVNEQRSNIAVLACIRGINFQILQPVQIPDVGAAPALIFSSQHFKNDIPVVERGVNVAVGNGGGNLCIALRFEFDIAPLAVLLGNKDMVGGGFVNPTDIPSVNSPACSLISTTWELM